MDLIKKMQEDKKRIDSRVNDLRDQIIRCKSLRQFHGIDNDQELAELQDEFRILKVTSLQLEDAIRVESVA